MPQVKLKAEVRSEIGSNAVKWLRRAGKLPAVLYGKELPEKSLAIIVDAHEFERLIATNPISTLIELQLESPKVAIIKEIQRHPVKRVPLHVDFLMVNLEQKQEFRVRVQLVGTAKGVKEGGVLEHISHSLTISCLPGNAPAQLEVDVSTLGLGEHIDAKDLQLPEGIELLADPLQVICTIKAIIEKEASEDAPAEPELIRERKPE